MAFGKFSVGRAMTLSTDGTGHRVRPVDVNGAALDDPTQVYSVAHPVIETDATGSVTSDSTKKIGNPKKAVISSAGTPVILINAVDGSSLGTTFGGGSSSSLLLGLNVNAPYYYNYNTVQNDIFQGWPWEYIDAGSVAHTLPAANLDSDGWPASTPSGNKIKRNIQIPRNKATQYTLSWTNGTGSTTVTCLFGSLTNVTATGATFTPFYQQSDGLHVEQFTFTYTGTPPKNITCTPVGFSPTALDSQFSSDTLAQTVSGGPIRDMKMVGVEPNDNQSTAFPSISVQTNTINGGQWVVDDGSAGWVAYTDGPPIAFLVAMANSLNRDLWDCYRLNYTNAQIDARATYVRDNLNPSLKYYVELANEVWNPFYNNQWNQLTAEATSESLLRYDNGAAGGGALERSIEKTIQLAQRVQTVWNAGGASKPTLQRVYNMQNGNAPNTTLLLNYSTTATAGSKLYQNIEVITSSLYFGNQLTSQTGGPDSTSTDATSLFAYGYTEADIVINNAVTTQTLAAAKGISYACYEAGQAFFVNDATTRNSLQTDSRMYDLYMYFLDQCAAKLGKIPMCMFLNVDPGQSNTMWGIKTYTGQTTSQAATPKYQSVVDFVGNHRKLQALVGSLAATAGSTNGTILGTLSRRTKGSNVIITSVPTGAVSFVDPTALILQVQVADATAFASTGSVTWSVVETDSRDFTGTRTTNGTCVVSSPHAIFDTTFNTNYTYTNGNQTATRASGASDQIVRSNSTHSGAGSWSFTVTPNSTPYIIGLCNSTQAPGDFLGDQSWAVGLNSSDGKLYTNGSALGSPIPTTGAGTTLTVTLKNNKLYYSGKWVLGDPVAQTGGYDVTSLGAVYAAMSTNTIGNAFTVDFSNWP